MGGGGENDEFETTITGDTVREMVATIQPDWTVTEIEREPEGTDFVATLTVETGDGPETVVLKATTAGHVPLAQARAEPRLLELVSHETTIPVPQCYGYCDDHETLPAPFYLLERVEGENFEGRPDDLSPEARERVCREAGHNIAALAELGPLPAAGAVGVSDGTLTVLDTDEFTSYDDSRTMIREGTEDALDALLDGGHFPELATDRERFADLVPDLRECVRETLSALPEPEPPTYGDRDYRYGNLLIDPDTGRTKAVIDWSGTMSIEPTYTIANAESLLFDRVRDDDALVDRCRSALRDAYTARRTDWTLDETARQRIDAYLLTNRIDRMAIFPLVYQDATEAERQRREADHREFVQQYL